MKTVLCVFVTMPVGGAESFWLNILSKLDQTRFYPITCCLARKGVMGEKIESLGYEVVELGRMKNKRFDTGAVTALARLIRERRVDIVHTHMYHANLYGRLAVMLNGRPRPRVVVSIHSLYTEARLKRTLINRLLTPYTDMVAAGSEPIKADVLKYDRVPPGKITVLPYGIDIERLDIPLGREVAKQRLGLSGSDFVLGTVGRLVEAKGHTYMLKTFAILKKSGYNFKLVIAGPGKLEAELMAEAESLGIAPDVSLLGSRQDIPEIYRAMDLYLMSSLWEGAPLALLDAMAAGVPSVVTDVGGMPDQLDRGSCGVIVPPKDPGAMAEAVLSLYNSREDMARLAENGVRRARESYGSGVMIKNLENIYDGLFEKRGGSV